MDSEENKEGKGNQSEKLRGLGPFDIYGKPTEGPTDSFEDQDELQHKKSSQSQEPEGTMNENVKIYFSHATPHTKAQEDFLEALKLKLEEHGADIEKWKHTFWDTKLALIPVQDKIAHVDGCVIVAFERLRTDSAVYKDVDSDLRKVHLPSVWVHMEAAMAYQAHRPILIFKDPALVDEGMLEKGVHDGKIIEIGPEDVDKIDGHLDGLIQQWIEEVQAAKAEELSRINTRKIVFFTANPKGTEQLQLSKEIRTVKDTLSTTKHRDQFTFISEPAVRIGTITNTVDYQRPEIIHFSGHGSGDMGLCVLDHNDRVEMLSTTALDRLFSNWGKFVKCAVLNACYSRQQAEVISRHGVFVVGMVRAVQDTSAINFAVGFYQGLGNGLSYTEAYDRGLTIVSTSDRDRDTPELWLNGKMVRSEQKY